MRTVYIEWDMEGLWHVSDDVPKYAWQKPVTLTDEEYAHFKQLQSVANEYERLLHRLLYGTENGLEKARRDLGLS